MYLISIDSVESSTVLCISELPLINQLYTCDSNTCYHFLLFAACKQLAVRHHSNQTRDVHETLANILVDERVPGS